MPDNSKSSFVVVRFNCRNYQSGGVVAVAAGGASADRILKDFEGGQSAADRLAGWRYFLEESDLKPGMDAETATKLRQARLDRQDSEK
jgi:hypothetical protein